MFWFLRRKRKRPKEAEPERPKVFCKDCKWYVYLKDRIPTGDQHHCTSDMGMGPFVNYATGETHKRSWSASRVNWNGECEHYEAEEVSEDES